MKALQFGRRRFAKAREAVGMYGQRALARASGISPQQVSAILLGGGIPTDETLQNFIRGIAKLKNAASLEKQRDDATRARIRELAARSGLRETARQLGVDPGNLVRMLDGDRNIIRINTPDRQAKPG
jgi:transcriptional regulator with XRE-family HTH domain